MGFASSKLEDIAEPEPEKVLGVKKTSNVSVIVEERKRRLEGMGVKWFIEFPNENEWVKWLRCTKCGEIISEWPYYMCSAEGHLTCKLCWENEPNLLCQFVENRFKPEIQLHPPISPEGQYEFPDFEDILVPEEENVNGEADWGEMQLGKTFSLTFVNSNFKSESESSLPTDFGKCFLDPDNQCPTLLSSPPSLEGSNETVLIPKICESPLEERNSIFVDRLLYKLVFNCPNHEYGCDYYATLKTIQHHYFNTCECT